MPRRLFALVAALGLLVAAGAAAVPGAMAGGGCHADLTGSLHNDGETSVVRMDVCSFEPTVARVPVGGEVRFLNTATIDHVVLGRGQTWGSGVNLKPGEERSTTFGEAGVFPYSCPLHPGMVGAIVVGDADTPPAAMGIGAPTNTSTEGEAPVAPADTGTSDEGRTGGIDPALAVGLGVLSGVFVLGLGALVVAVRRRPVIDAVSR